MFFKSVSGAGDYRYKYINNFYKFFQCSISISNGQPSFIRSKIVFYVVDIVLIIK